ncbi:NAD(P)-dependent oxidoreductase [Clostridium sp. LIBA-8841]|uniref:NAD(P)-dependent oxidoreductase n=1 Tax=Clostridium sp. LIBA-8841 TaxID=2987530 RepID=UPI002AC72DE9|nr:NAD(P)-dependent oxidoreductase [Clostridium sp. LIBA-8841]MDZ5252335.1 NAD(P)-dependent oxidoreductase [Clostridium sp. LIBA-8841]
MCRNNREDIFNLVPINIISSKFHVKVIGGGKAAFIKVKGLLEKGCYVHILSKKFSKEILDINNENLKLEEGTYYKEFIKDAHLIIIAIDEDSLAYEICKDCDEEYKLYLNATNYKDGMVSIPYSRCYENLGFSISSKLGSPRITRAIGEEVSSIIKENDMYSIKVAKIREKAKKEELKSEIIKVISSNEFKKAFLEEREYEYLSNVFGEKIAYSLTED